MHKASSQSQTKHQSNPIRASLAFLMVKQELSDPCNFYVNPPSRNLLSTYRRLGTLLMDSQALNQHPLLFDKRFSILQWMKYRFFHRHLRLTKLELEFPSSASGKGSSRWHSPAISQIFPYRLIPVSS